MPFYDKGDVRIRYEEAGAGFPLLVMPGGGLNSRISNWATAPFNAVVSNLQSSEVRACAITLYQRWHHGGNDEVMTTTAQT